MEHLPFDSQWRAHYPNFYRFYNGFEDSLPYAGHLGYLDALCVASKHLANQDRGFSLVKIADPGDGKSVTSRQFESLPNVNFDMHISKSGFFEKYCGTHLVKLGNGFVPRGVVKLADGAFDASNAVEYIHMHTAMITEAESLASMHDSSLSGLIHIFDPLIEEGKLSYSDTYNGEYVGGYGDHRLSFNLSMGLTPRGFRRFMYYDTFATRVLIAYYRSLECERADVRRKIEHGTLMKEPRVQEVVREYIYSRLHPDETKELTFEPGAEKALQQLTEFLIQLRTGSIQYAVVGKRDAKIARQLAGSVALLEARQSVTIADVWMAIALMKSSSATHAEYTDDDGKTHQMWTYTASKAHFLAYLCHLARIDAHEHLRKFTNFEGGQLYADREIDDVLVGLGLKAVKVA